MKKNRLQWIDNMRGLAVYLVLLSHTPQTNIVELTLASLFLIPSFFLISGYLTKYDGSDVFGFFYNRVLKLLIVYIAYVFLVPFLSVSEVVKVSKNPLLIANKIFESGKNLILGKTMWFIACLILVNIIFMVIRKISRSNKELLIISIVIACIGVGLSFVFGEGRRPWCADVALVCQVFFSLGYILKDIERQEWYENERPKAFITGCAYVVIMLISGYFLGFSNVSINVAIGDWGKLWITIPMVLLSLYSGLCSSRIFSRLKILPFIGQNSLLYFAIGSHGTAVVNKIFGIISSKYGFDILSNRALINPIIALLGAIILVPVCWFVSKYAPFFNGSYKMPKLKRICNVNSTQNR